jgi:putative hemolysin
MVLIEAAVLALLFTASAFFAAAEAALTALSSLRMKKIGAFQPRLVAHFSRWLSKPHELLITILVGNNLANMAFSSLTGALFLPLLAGVPAGEILVWLAASALVLIFAEIVPKIVGRVYAERIASRALPPLWGMARLLTFLFVPAQWLIARTGKGLEAPVNRLTALSLEEMQHVIQETEAAGQVPRESGEMMARVLSLHRRTVADILQPAHAVDSAPLEMLDAGGSEELFVDRLVESGRSRVPVTRAGVPVGVLHAMDLLKEWKEGRVESLEGLVRPARWVPPSKEVAELLADFQKSGDHMALVEGEGGEFLGLATLEDVLEEVVGEILDEYDLEQKKTDGMAP